MASDDTAIQQYPLATVDGIHMLSLILQVDDVWRGLTKAQRKALAASGADLAADMRRRIRSKDYDGRWETPTVVAHRKTLDHLRAKSLTDERGKLTAHAMNVLIFTSYEEARA